MGLTTVTGIRRRGFFIPHRHAAAIDPAGDRRPYGAVETLMASRRHAFTDMLARIDGYADILLALDGSPPEPRWQQDWFPRTDGAAAYAMVRSLAPRRIIEVGSGHSTRFVARAVRDADLDTPITAIDPAPRADIGQLPVTVVETLVQNADPALFAALGAGDILMVDSSHILMPGTDVDLMLNRVLPALPAGVLVHIHDIFLPDPYPLAWSWRGYNEQLGVAPLLIGGAFEVLFSSHYVLTRMADAWRQTVLARLPCPDGALESALWLRKVSGCG